MTRPVAALELILRKRDGGRLSAAELERLVLGYLGGEVPDYQMSAFLMACYFRGLDFAETRGLTEVLWRSGRTVDLSGIPGVVVDKHSSGGVGDKTTLVLAPLLASYGIAVAKLAGRGLGHTGGTLDKLEAIPGLSSRLSPERLRAQVARIGVAIASQSEDLAPADGALYALRDVTGTVESPGLIAASILSKKLAGGAPAILLDVKVGEGALLREEGEARRLAELMIAIGESLGRRVDACLTGMQQPLGRAVGNACEVREALSVLRGEGPSDVRRLVLALAVRAVRLAQRVGGGEGDEGAIEAELARHLDHGAYRRFCELVEAQGGNAAALERSGPRLDGLPLAAYRQPVTAARSGWVERCDARAVGMAAVALGAGRERKGEPIDPAAGIWLERKVGEWVEAGEPLAWLEANDPARLGRARERLLAAYRIGPDRPAAPPLLLPGPVSPGAGR